MTNTLILVLVALTLGTGVASYFGLAGTRNRRRVAWELERVAWRRWITRP